MKQKKLIFNFFVNRNWKKLTDSRKRAKILADNRKGHDPIETLSNELYLCFLAIVFLLLLSILHEHNIKCISYRSLWQFNLLCVIFQISSTNECMLLILSTSLILPNELSSYPTRKDKSFTLLPRWTTQLNIQYVPIHNKNPVASWQCFEMHIFNTNCQIAT